MGSDASRSGFCGWGGLPGETPKWGNAEKLARAEAGLRAYKKWANSLLDDIRELERRAQEAVWLLEHVERQSDTSEWLARRAALIARIRSNA